MHTVSSLSELKDVDTHTHTQTQRHIIMQTMGIIKKQYIFPNQNQQTINQNQKNHIDVVIVIAEHHLLNER